MDAEIVAGWDFGRIIPCHGDVVEGDAKKKWIQTFEKVSVCAGRARVQGDLGMGFECVDLAHLSPLTHAQYLTPEGKSRFRS